MKKLHLKKWHKILLGVLLFFTLILFAVPRVAKRYFVRHSNDIIGREVAIDKVRLNYFTGRILIKGFKLFEQDGSTAFVSFDRFKVNIDYLPFLRRELFVRYAVLDEPYVQVLQDGSRFNFSDLITSSDTTGSAAKDTVTGAPVRYVINNIAISGGYVRYTDMVLSHTIALNNLDLEIPGFTWNSGSTNLDAGFRFVDGGGFYSALALDQADSTFALRLRLDSINLDIIEPYVQNFMFISALHGYLSNDLQINGSMKNLMHLRVSGKNNIYGLQLIDTLDRTLLSFNEMMIDIDSVIVADNMAGLRTVTITDPFVLFELTDTTNNWMALIKPSAATPADTLQHPADTTGEGAGFSYTIPALALTGGRISFADRTMRYPFNYEIDNFSVSTSASAKDPGKLDLQLSARLNGTGTMTAEAEIDPADLNDMDVNLKIGQFRMKDMEPYFMHYLGYPVNGGIMNFTTGNVIRQKSLTSNNNLYLRKFTLAERTDRNCEYKLPIRLALGILSDKDGIIDLEAPVETRGDEVKVRNLGRIIFRIIGNLFIKAAVSPFNALAGSYNTDPASLQEIRLSLIEAVPDADNMKTADVIAEILADKPGLNVDMYYCIDRAVASDSLAYLMTTEDFIDDRREKGIDVSEVADSTLTGFITEKLPSLASEGSTDLRALCRSYIGTEKLNAVLDSLRTIQTGFMSDYLGRDRELPAERFRIITTVPDTIMPPENYPAFRVYFTAGNE